MGGGGDGVENAGCGMRTAQSKVVHILMQLLSVSGLDLFELIEEGVACAEGQGVGEGRIGCSV